MEEQAAAKDARGASFLAYRNDRLELEGLDLERILERTGSPAFVFSERRLTANFRALRDGFVAAGASPRVRYCAKTNHEAGLLAILAREGAELLASHLGEVELALRTGFPADRISFQRPVVSDGELDAVLDRGVSRLHVFRVEDASRFREAAGRPLRLSLRLRPPAPLLPSPLSNLNARLGLDETEALGIARAGDAEALNVYVGTQRGAARAFDRALGVACRLAAAIHHAGAPPIAEINVGGGIPSPSMRRLAVRTLFARWRDRPRIEDAGPDRLRGFATDLARRFLAATAAARLASVPDLACESGRGVVGNAGLLLTRVRAADGRWLFLDASRNVLGESPILFRRSILPLLARNPGERLRRFHLSGSTLNTLDVVDFMRRLPRLEPGAGLAICDAGAYTISRATRYAGLAPAVFLVSEAGELRPIRRCETVEDLAGPMAPAFGGDEEPGP